jgi:hypothetical protein
LAGTVLPWGPEQRRYFWTRLTTTACEDVGYGDPELTRFVIACATVFPPSAGEPLTKHVWSFLTACMCEARRSRIHCQLSLLEDWTERERVPTPTGLTHWDRSLLGEIHRLSNKSEPFWSGTRFNAWHQKNNWRGQNMLKFAVYPCAVEAVPDHKKMPPSEVLCRLPDFCYDMHTRVGKQAYRQLRRLPAVQEFFQAHHTSRKAESVGWAVFLQEGALVRDGLVDDRLLLLEQKYIASRFGWTLLAWESFQQLIAGLLLDGSVNRFRKSILDDGVDSD